MRSSPAGALVWIDGEITPGEQARVSVFDRGFLYGDSVYEVTRTAAAGPLFLDEHLHRLQRSGAGIGLDVPPLHELRRAVFELWRAFGLFPAYLRLIVTRGAGEMSLDPIAADRPLVVVIMKPLALPDARLYADGAVVTIVDLRRNAPGHVPAWVKSGNYLSSVLAMAEVRRRGAYEAVLCDPDGHLAEGASSNIFTVRGGAVRTPPARGELLPGITRAAVLGLCYEAGVPAVETALTPADLRGADEAFLTSSVRGLLPVVRCDDRPIGDGRPGPITRDLLRRYRHLLDSAPAGALC